MSDRIIVILHDKADEAYVAALVGALAPARAVSAEFSKARDFQFGAGSACVVVWSAAAASAAGEDALILSKDAIVLRVGDVPAFAHTGAREVCGSGEAVSDATLVADAVVRLERISDLPAGTKTYRAAIAGGTSPNMPPPQREGKARLVGRSAFGLFATVSVVAVAAQYIGFRSGATAAAPVDTDTSATASDHAAIPASAPDASDDVEYSSVAPVEESPLFELTRLNNVAPVEAEAPVAEFTTTPLAHARFTQSAPLGLGPGVASETPDMDPVVAIVTAAALVGTEADGPSELPIVGAAIVEDQPAEAGPAQDTAASKESRVSQVGTTRTATAASASRPDQDEPNGLPATRAVKGASGRVAAGRSIQATASSVNLKR
jgi:hypothetical protein